MLLKSSMDLSPNKSLCFLNVFCVYSSQRRQKAFPVGLLSREVTKKMASFPSVMKGHHFTSCEHSHAGKNLLFLGEELGYFFGCTTSKFKKTAL